jgi:hypothetical protein
MFDGERLVRLIELSEKGVKQSDNGVVPDLLRRAPPVFLERLPSGMTK